MIMTRITHNDRAMVMRINIIIALMTIPGTRVCFPCTVHTCTLYLFQALVLGAPSHFFWLETIVYYLRLSTINKTTPH